MRPSSIAMFPFENDLNNDCLKRAHTVNDTLISAIRAYLVTRRGSRLGNMVGCFLPDIIFDLVGISDVSGLAKELKRDLSIQFPGVNFLNVTLSLDSSNETQDLIVRISFSTQLTDITDMEVVMPTILKK